MSVLATRIADAVRGLYRRYRCTHGRGAVLAVMCPWCEDEPAQRQRLEPVGTLDLAEPRRALSPDWRGQVMP